MDVDGPESAAEVRFTTETRVPENGSGDLMDVDGPEFVAEVALMNETRAREFALINTQGCFPKKIENRNDDPPSSDGLPMVLDPPEGQAPLVSQAFIPRSVGAGTGLDFVMNEIIDHSQSRNDHGLRNEARVGEGHHRDVRSQADSQGDRRKLTKVKHSRVISKTPVGPSTKLRRQRQGRRQ